MKKRRPGVQKSLWYVAPDTSAPAGPGTKTLRVSIHSHTGAHEDHPTLGWFLFDGHQVTIKATTPENEKTLQWILAEEVQSLKAVNAKKKPTGVTVEQDPEDWMRSLEINFRAYCLMAGRAETVE